MRSFLPILALVATAAVASPGPATAQGSPPVPASSTEPFKLGTFEIGNDGQDRVGIVLRDQFVVELGQANNELERRFYYARVPMPEHMLGFIERYDYGLRTRVYEIVNHVVAGNLLSGTRPAWIHRLEDVRTLAPIRNPYPEKILNARVNYFDHISEGASDAERAATIAARRADRGTAYLFHKTVRGGVIGQGDTIVIPYGRDRADWEVELAVVIGRQAKYVSARNADDYIFGYTIHIDVSDRGGHPQGGSDWFVGKGRDTYAPVGPFIVPKEFFAYPGRHVSQRFVLRAPGQGGAVMQDSGTDDMIHSLAELIEFGSSVATLFPGDIIAAGSPAGVGSGVSVRGYQWFMQHGNTAEATIEGIGTLRHPVVKEQTRPEGTGEFLPPTPWDPNAAGTTPWQSGPTVP